MGESVSEATIISWNKNVGDMVELDETVIEIATDKVDSEVPSTHEGKLVEMLFAVDDVVQVGEPFAILETNDGEVDMQVNNTSDKEITKEEVETFKEVESIEKNETTEKITTTIKNTGERFYSPLVRSMASKEGIEMNELESIKNVSLNSLWGNPVPSDVSLAFGMTHENVLKLRSRLNKMGYPVEDNGSMVFDRQVENAAKRFQEYHGLNPDGVFGKRSLEAINVHPNTRAIQILVNLERLRWNNSPRSSEYILVNQPNFEAFFEKNGERVWESRVVIGLPSNQTAEFNDFMTHIIVNPTWHVPKSIAVDEYLPMIQSDPNFLSDNDMRLMVRGTNTVIDSTLIDMQAFTPENFPFLIKQNPSNINALGLVKFMFPNKFSIYMHDTPMKDLFFKDERTFSHGCIRLQEPFEFAYSLLRDQTENPETKFHEILTKNEETQLNLNREIPVKIIYRTAFFDKFGQVQFRPDIYGRDALVYMALSEAGVKIF